MFYLILLVETGVHCPFQCMVEAGYNLATEICPELSRGQQIRLAAPSLLLVPALQILIRAAGRAETCPGSKATCPVGKVGQGKSRQKLLLCPSLSKGTGKSLLWFGTEGCPMSLASPGWHHSWHMDTAKTSHSSVKGTKGSSEAALRAASLAHSSFPRLAVHHLP